MDLTKKELLHIAAALDIKNCQNKTKQEIADLIVSKYKSRGGVMNLGLKGVAMPLHARKRPSKTPPSKVASMALTTSVEMMKDTLSSTLANNVINVKSLPTRVITALAAASDANDKIQQSVKSDERKQRRKHSP